MTLRQRVLKPRTGLLDPLILKDEDGEISDSGSLKSKLQEYVDGQLVTKKYNG
jgi:hypothetical protein